MNNFPSTKEEKKFYKEYCQLVRLALTGQKVGPDLYKLMEILGKDEVCKRLRDFIDKYKND